jgi:GAF domain-containing protein
MRDAKDPANKRRELEYFGTFFEASHALLTSASLRQTLQLLVRRAVRVLRLKSGSLMLLNETTNRLGLMASHLVSKKYLRKGPLDADRSIPEVLEGKTVLIKDAFRDARIQYKAEALEEGINSILSVPVVAKQRVIGVLRLYTARPRDFTSEELEFVSALAGIGGLAIANARIQEQEGVKLSLLLNKVGIDLPKQPGLRKQRLKSFPLPSLEPARSLELFRELRDVTSAILSSLNSIEVMDLILDKLIKLMNVKGSSLRLINETTRELELVASRGLSKTYLKKGPVHADKSISEALRGEPALVTKEGIASILSIPITAQDRVIGVLRLYSAEPRKYNRDDVSFLLAVAEIAGVVIINAKLYERTKYDLSFWRTTVDYLTQ